MTSETITEISHWHPVTGSPTLPRGGLHLWRVRTGNDGAPLADLWPLLSQRESERAQKLRLVHHRERYVRAHAGLRMILSSYVDIEPLKIEFRYGKAGKPMLEATASVIQFNMTTSGNLALVAVCAGEPVGVDCEQVRERKGVAAIARRMFRPEEAAQIATASLPDRLVLFHLAWTALEAGVKVDGRGLAHRRDPSARGNLDIRHCVPEPGVMAAVARRELPPVEQWTTLQLAYG